MPSNRYKSMCQTLVKEIFILCPLKLVGTTKAPTNLHMSHSYYCANSVFLTQGVYFSSDFPTTLM